VALDVTLGAATLVTGLITGVYYAYACSVMPGLARTDDRVFVDAMQQINDAIQNPVFFVSFLGAPVLSGAATVLARRSASRRVTRLTAAAFALSLVAIAVTAAVNVPLNDELARAGNPGHIADLAHVRDKFENPWIAWNIVRTIASTASLGGLVGALASRRRGA
jgi:uncharacterized membrane protein